jgi:O-methyltransferase involved in polyketide biosynthesis
MAQSPANDFDKISPTAFMTCIARQFTDIPFSKELAQRVMAHRSAHLSVLLEARYKAINQVMSQYPITQILELASGFLPRGLAMTENPCITFIESDLPAMIERKQHLLQELCVERPNLHLLEIDATSRPSQLIRSADYFKDEQPVMILCEGLLMYLTHEEKQKVCANVREMLEHFGGIWITSDFASTIGLRQAQRLDVNLQKRMEKVTHLTGRSLADNAFETHEQARQFARKEGFRITEFSALEIRNQLSCLKILNIDPETVNRMLETHSVFALTLETDSVAPF